jgi:carbamoyltransferase
VNRPGVVLGLCAFVHDSSAALIVDGDLRGFVEEERLDGVKHSKAYPQHGVGWLLEQAGLCAEDVEAVGYHLDGRLFLAAIGQSLPLLADRSAVGRVVPRMRSFAKVHHNFRVRMRILQQHFPAARIHPVQHHRAHGLYAFAASGFEQAAVLVVDSLGEYQTTTIATADASGWHQRWQQRGPASLGYAYGAITEHLGWHRGDEEGTVMALAATGDPARFRNLMQQAVAITANGIRLDHSLLALRVLSGQYPRTSARLSALACEPRRPGDPVEQVHADLAAALQERTGQVMIALARRARNLTGSHLLCLGGGVAANCVAAGQIVDEGLFDEVFIPPAPGDSGTAIGAALATFADHGGGPVTGVEGACYLGPSFTGQIMDEPTRPGMSVEKISTPARFLARQLADGKIVGVVRGGIEAGPRALGHRSILASPLLPGVVDRLNATVKFREPFRPFAPMVLCEDAADYFTLGQDAPFMSFASPVTALARDKIPAVVHANGTARLQTVTTATEPFIAEVLAEFASITGVPVLINTSLNIKGKPICGTVAMALDCLAETGLDALLVDDCWVSKT